jgi:ABC-2 type transport system ATP-binding protein
VHDLVVDTSKARFDVDSAELAGVLRHLAAFEVQTLTSQPPTLEELFMRHYGDAPAGTKR